MTMVVDDMTGPPWLFPSSRLTGTAASSPTARHSAAHPGTCYPSGTHPPVTQRGRSAPRERRTRNPPATARYPISRDGDSVVATGLAQRRHHTSDSRKSSDPWGAPRHFGGSASRGDARDIEVVLAVMPSPRRCLEADPCWTGLPRRDALSGGMVGVDYPLVMRIRSSS